VMDSRLTLKLNCTET